MSDTPSTPNVPPSNGAPSNGAPDVNDVIRTMLGSAEAAGAQGLPVGDSPQAEAAREEVARQALDHLEAIVAKMELAQDKTEAGRLVAAVLARGPFLEALGLALGRRWADVTSRMVRLRKCTTRDDCRALEVAIRTAADAYAESVRSRAKPQPKKAYNLGRDLPWLRVPNGWVLDEAGVHSESQSKDGVITNRFASTPAFITEALVSLQDGKHRVRIDWRNGDGSWVSKIVARADVRDTRAILSLGNDGLDVGSHNARDMVAWLAEQEGLNAAAMPKARTSDRLGWLGEHGELGFLSGRQLIAPTRAATQSDNQDSRSTTAPVVTFHADDGYGELADAIAPHGTLDGWKAAVLPFLHWPYPTIALYASLAAPFLGLLAGAPNLILDLSSTTRKGKTACLSFGASAWGRPKKGDHLVHSWQSSPTFLERATAACRHLPFYCDDTRDAAKPEDLQRIVYMYSGGAGKGRASAEGLRKTATTRGILISTGEMPLSSFGDAAGARARVLSLRDLPFGDKPQGPLVRGVLADLDNHHGTAGPEVVRWLVAHPDRHDAIRATWLASQAKYAARASDSVGDSVAGALALLDAGHFAAHVLLGLPEHCDALTTAWECATASAGEASDRPVAALRAVYNWAIANPTDFWGRHSTMPGPSEEPRKPAKGWAGAWSDSMTWSDIGFIPEVLERVLRFQGFSQPAEILTGWKERGLIKRDGKHLKCKRHVGDLETRLVCIARDVLESL